MSRHRLLKHLLKCGTRNYLYKLRRNDFSWQFNLTSWMFCRLQETTCCFEWSLFKLGCRKHCSFRWLRILTALLNSFAMICIDKLTVENELQQVEEVIYSRKDKTITHLSFYFNDTIDTQVSQQKHLGSYWTNNFILSLQNRRYVRQTK